MYLVIIALFGLAVKLKAFGKKQLCNELVGVMSDGKIEACFWQIDPENGFIEFEVFLLNSWLMPFQIGRAPREVHRSGSCLLSVLMASHPVVRAAED